MEFCLNHAESLGDSASCFCQGLTVALGTHTSLFLLLNSEEE